MLATRRIGKINVAWSMINDYPEVVHQITNLMIVLQAYERYDMQCITYVCIHPSFDEVEPGSKAPYYMPHYRIVTDPDGEKITVFDHFEKLP